MACVICGVCVCTRVYVCASMPVVQQVQGSRLRRPSASPTHSGGDAASALGLFHSTLHKIAATCGELEALSASGVESPSLAVFDPVHNVLWARTYL